MKLKNKLSGFLLKEWLLTVSGAAFALTSIYTGRCPEFSVQELEVIFFLFTLFITIKGLENSGLLTKISQNLEKGKAIPLKLVLITFFLSMAVTNDVALIITIPLTLSLKTEHMDILVILEALAANAGSALTPFGNPQNLFIYWFYNIHPLDFIYAIAPFSICFLIILGLCSFAVRITKTSRPDIQVKNSAYVYIACLIVVIMAVLRLLPLWAAAAAAGLVALADPENMKTDYALLATFFFFFGVADNIELICADELHLTGNIFLASAAVSQVISNVPAALLFARVTDNWQALLWGTNTGGFGSLVGSVANLIAYRLYINHDSTDNCAGFTIKFLAMGCAAFFTGTGLYYFIMN